MSPIRPAQELTVTRAATLAGACAAALALGACQPEARPEAPLSDAARQTEAQGAIRAGDRFWSHWSDGKAELDGYDLIQPRYGEKRHGRAVLVYVTEPWSRARNVKVDRYNPQDPDHTMALKLNAVRKFQTGVYDYSVLTSVFVEPGRGFAPMEITFSMQEWCGHVFEEAHFGDKAEVRLNSYFEGESGEATLPTGANFVAEDTLLIGLRGLAADELERKSGVVTLLGSATQRRLKHMPVKAFESKIAWSDKPSEVTVPAGTFKVHEATWGRQGGDTCTAWIEVAYPHRVIGWRCGDGEEARMTGSKRIPYWNTHREGDEVLLKELGLEPVGFAPDSKE